jgi:hypothetical protein
MIIWLADNLWIALKTGIANARGSLYKRKKNPVKYWVTVAVQTGFLIGFIAFFISFISEFF